MSTTTATVAANVRAELSRRRLTQAWLGDLLNLSQQSVSRRLAGVVPFDVDEIGAIAAEFGMSLASLLEPAMATIAESATTVTADVA